jgi:hypothetical protein
MVRLLKSAEQGGCERIDSGAASQRSRFLQRFPIISVVRVGKRHFVREVNFFAASGWRKALIE